MSANRVVNCESIHKVWTLRGDPSLAGFKSPSLTRTARFWDWESDATVTTIQRLSALIDRIDLRTRAGEALPAEFRDQYPHLAAPVERPAVVGYSVGPR